MVDLAIRDGILVDGTGAPPQPGTDVLVEGGRIVRVGRRLGGRARREIAADGLLITPGFVDNHTHYDGQATWDDELAPSVWHGVTTVVMGNCGVGFAPARRDQHELLIELMEGVEDIPGSALAEGITWDWESFPEYVDALDRTPRTMDVATHLAHSPLRTYVMGERGARNEAPTADDLAMMARLVTEAIRSGALGVSSSRTMLHRAPDRSLVPGTLAEVDEISALAGGIAAAGFGIFEVASDVGINSTVDDAFAADLDWMIDLSATTGLPVTYPLLQNDRRPELWREILDRTESGRDRGARVVALTAGRPGGILLGLSTSLHPFLGHPAYQPIKDLPLAAKVAELRRPDVRALILSERSRFASEFARDVSVGFWKMFPMGDPPDYEPAAEDSVEARAARLGVSPAELCYDLLLEDDGRSFLFFPMGDFAHRSLDSLYERLQRPGTLLSLGDGGAHCRLISDASVFTYMLTYWARDRAKGPQLSVERAVQLMTSSSADLYRLYDRGVVAPGRRADLNVIDHSRLRFGPPRMVADLPAGGERLLQEATGYVATICGGEITVDNGEITDCRPGRVVRGPRPEPT
ncbi:MAG: amidohydrolase family protein [Actinomycetota bacterium]|jgi:N-acyl-D-amino-acid deacylase